MTNKNFTFSNQNCSFSFNLETKEISGSDHTDQWNMPRCYNQNTRSIKKALESVTKSFNDNLSMYQVMNIICDAGVRMRSYCSMD